MAAVDGPLPVADAIIAAAAAAAVTYESTQRVFVTYIAYNPLLILHYCGRTSGFGTPESILASRINMHHALNKNFAVNIDKTIQGIPLGFWCIRGREQQNIDYHGGALTEPSRPSNATCSNKIRGVAKYNPFGGLYHWASSTAWGQKSPYTGYGPSDIESVWDKIKQFKRMQEWLKY